MMFKWLREKLLECKVLTRPEELPPYIIKYFEEATEEQIAAAEAEVSRAYPWNPEVALMYALRVSKIVPKIKTFKTLVSRWNVASKGPRGVVGLCAGRSSKNYDRTYQFLSDLYVKRFVELARETADKAEITAAKRKSLSAKQKAYHEAGRKMLKSAGEMSLPWNREASQWAEYLRQRARSITDD